MRAVLGNVEEMAREYPGFEAPPAEYREGLQPGDLAELMFLSEQAPQGRWAEVTEVPQPGWYRGILDSGEWVDFGPEHVADVKGPRPQMGVSPWYYPPGPEGVPKEKPSIWEWQEHARWVEAQRKKKAEERAAKGLPPKRSFWEWLSRKKRPPEVKPIPEPERRGFPARGAGLLPGPVEVFEGPPPPPEPPRAPAAPVPEIIVPPAPPATPSPRVPDEIIVSEEPEAPISYFDILGPEKEAPKKEERGIILLPSGPIEPPAPTGLVPAGPADVFSVLAPAPPPGGLIVQEGPRAPAVRQTDVFEILAPGVPPSAALTPFDVLGPAPGAPAPAVTPFDVLSPAPGGMVVAQPGEVTPFDVLEPAGGMVVAPPGGPASPFDVLLPETGLAPYTPPSELSPFDIAPPAGGPGWGGWAEPGFAAKEEEEEPRKKKKAKKSKMQSLSVWSSVEDRIRWIHDHWYLDRIWDKIRKEKESDWYKHEKIREEDPKGSGQPYEISIDTWQDGDNVEFAYRLGVPYSEIRPYIQAMDKEAEEEGGTDESRERWMEEVEGPLSENIHDAMKTLQPPDIKGDFFLGSDVKFDDAYGVLYYEKMPKKEVEKIRREMEEKEREERKEADAKARVIRERNKTRQEELKKIWGRLPDVQDILPWVEQMYQEQFWKSVKKLRKSEAFQREKENAAQENEYGILELEPIAEDGPQLYDQLNDYFGIPPQIFDVYFKTGPFKDAQSDLWNEVLYPYFQVAAEALNSVKPKGLPGWFDYAWDGDEHEFFLRYLEE